MDAEGGGGGLGQSVSFHGQDNIFSNKSGLLTFRFIFSVEKSPPVDLSISFAKKPRWFLSLFSYMCLAASLTLLEPSLNKDEQCEAEMKASLSSSHLAYFL